MSSPLLTFRDVFIKFYTHLLTVYSVSKLYLDAEFSWFYLLIAKATGSLSGEYTIRGTSQWLSILSHTLQDCQVKLSNRAQHPTLFSYSHKIFRCFIVYLWQFGRRTTSSKSMRDSRTFSTECGTLNVESRFLEHESLLEQCNFLPMQQLGLLER